MPNNSLRTGLSPTDALVWGLSSRQSMLDGLLAVRQEIAAAKLDQEQLTFWTLIDTSGDQGAADAIVGASRPVRIERRDVGSASRLRIQSEGGDPFVVSVWPQADGVVHLVSTVPASDGRWQRLERWIAHAGRLTPFYLNEEDFLAVGEGMAEFGRVEVSKLTWRDGRQSHAVGYSANRPTLAEAVHGDLPTSGQVRTALMRAGELSIHLRRLAGATFYSGDLRAFDVLVLSRLKRAASERALLLRDRQREVGRVPRALSVRLPEPILRTADDTAEVVRILSSDTRLAVGVVHRNPYLHLAVTDYFDGSSFDVFVTSAHEVSVHAGFRASLNSLNRVLQRLTEQLQARGVGEQAALEQPTKQDLLISH